MFQFQDLFRGNLFNSAQITALENKLEDLNYPLEDFLKDDSAISCVKSMGKNTQKYLNPEKIKQLIKLITEEPQEEDQLRGHKFPYVACEILKSNCPFILKRFVLNEQEYDEEFPDNNSDDEKEIDFDFCKNDVDKEYSKIEEKIKNLKNADDLKDGKIEEKNIIEKDNDNDNDNNNKKTENEINNNNLNKNENNNNNVEIRKEENKENNMEEKKEDKNNDNGEENNKEEKNNNEIKDKNEEGSDDKKENNDEKEIKNENNKIDDKEKEEELNENQKKEEFKSSDNNIEGKKEEKNIEDNIEDNNNKEENENKEEKENKGIEESKEEKNVKDKEDNESSNKDIKDIKEKDETQENLGKEKAEDVANNENKEKKIKEELEEKNNKNEDLEDKKEQELDQERNEETENIESTEEKEENIINDNKLNGNENEVEINLKKEEDSLSIEGEIEDIYSKKPKQKKTYENKPNNDYLDLLLNFVMNDQPEFNYVLSGYFANVMINLLDKYPTQILKYLYTIRKDALRKIVFHSHQKAFSILSLKLLNFENFQDKEFETNRNELIGEIIKSISLEGIKDDKNEIKDEIDLEAKFGLIFEMINENKKIIKYLVFNGDVYAHMFEILDTNLYNNDTKTENNENNFDNKYNIYSLFIVLITKLLKNACLNYLINYPNEFDFNSIKKPKKELTFSENMILTFGKILKNNFLPKKPILILEKYSTIPYEGLGMLNIKIMELAKEMMNFMRQLPKQFDSLLLRNHFIQRSIDYFFKYQWNNIYQIQFVDFFNLYLSEEERHKELTEFFFENIKLHEILLNYLNQNNIDEKDIDKIIPKQRLKFSFRSGKTINSGIYAHVIDLIYKIQAISGLDIFTEEEKSELKIKNYGEFEFSKDEKSNKFIRKINISNNVQNKLKKSKLWNDITKSTVIPLVKKYETKLGKSEEKKSEEDNEIDELEYLLPKRNSMGASNMLFQQLISIIKKETNQKRFSLPLSRNDKNENKGKNDKNSIREKLLNKRRFNNKKIFEDDDNDKKKQENEDIRAGNEDDETNDSEENNKYNDTNYWEVKNTLPTEIKKEVDKKTNIIFNYNPTTYELNNKEVSEEDELLSIAMGLEQNEKTEKNKKIMYIMPGKLKPINLKAKKNPVQSIFTSVASSNNDNIEDDSHNKKDKENILEENEDKDDKQNENEEDEEEEAIIKNDDDKSKEENKDIDENIEIDNYKIYNDVNYWNTGNYLNEKEMEDCLKDL